MKYPLKGCDQMKKKAIKKTSLKVLYLEDSPKDVEIIRELLVDARFDLNMDCTEKKKEFIAFLRRNKYDVILSDFSVPGFDAFGALQLAIDICPDVPFICVSGSIGEETAIELIKQGAVDYILKDRMARLPVAIKRALDDSKEKVVRKRMEEELRESEDKFKYVFDNSIIGKSLTLVNGEVNSNKSFAQMLGYTQEEINKKRWQDLTPVEEIESIKKITDSIVSGENESARFYKRYIHKNGSIIWADVSTSLRRDNNNKPLYFITSVVDITERKKAENEIKIVNNRLKLALEVSKAGTWNWDIINDEFYWSEEFLRLFGMDENTIPGFDVWSKSLHPDDVEIASKTIQESIEDRTALNNEYRIILPNKEIRWILATGNTFYDFDKPIRMVGLCQDITERKWAELEILKLNRIYAVLSNINKLIVRERDRQILFNETCKIAVEHGKMIMCWIGLVDDTTGSIIPSTSAGTIDGYLDDLQITLSDNSVIKGTTADILKERRHDVCNDIEHFEGFFPRKEKALALGYKSSASFLLCLSSKCIGTIYFYSQEVNFFNEEEISLLDELANDISYALESIKQEEQRIKAEEKLYRSEERYRSIFENVQDVYYETQLDGIILEVSPSIEIISKGQYHREDLIGKSMYEYYANPNDRDNLIAVMKKTGSVTDFEVRLKNGDGSLICCSISAKLRFNSEGQIEKIIGSMHDISKRKQAEEEILKSERRYRNLFENAGIAIWEEDLSDVKNYFNQLTENGIRDFRLFFNKDINEVIKCASLVKLIDINKEVLNIFKGNSKEEVLKSLPSFFVEESLEAVKELLVGLAEGKLRIDGEIPQKILTGEIRQFLFQLTIVPGYEETWGKALFSFIDITERRRLNEELLNERVLLKNIVENIPIPLYVKDLHGRKIMANQAEAIFAGKNTVEEVIGKTNHELYSHEAAEKSRLEDENIIKTGKSIRNLEGSFTDNEGKQGWYIGNKVLLKDSKGDPFGILGVNIDITTRKLAEESLRKSREDLLKFFEDDISADFISTASGELINCNQTFLDMFGFKSKKEALTFPINKLYRDLSSRDKFNEVLKKNKKVENFEGEYLSLEGRIIYTLENAVAESDKTGKLVQIRGYVVDITEKIKANEKLRQISRAVEQSPASVIITNQRWRY